ncbi:hypothetical protein GC425_00980 [Corynebacterium sp. zg254]|uniref:Secreted protein n=1 Tax=Corynebacterium zhongnanshanii TaxID=2768834 RepID=A0ABQ6VG70_9CORY|nr:MULTISPECIES: hypothetical protein [Corynebacterium]KAB3523417.1 hypothetical protein F8377_04650 [Corynebacterium zhongnanshanii]MCR5913450.1 hypothetical protein [Corynebacterium sp. zg254]
MKNTRTAALAALALTGALALSACTPPHQNDSTSQKPDTATEGPAMPSIDPAQEARTTSSAEATATAPADEAAEAEAGAQDATGMENQKLENSTNLGNTGSQSTSGQYLQ